MTRYQYVEANAMRLDVATLNLKEDVDTATFEHDLFIKESNALLRAFSDLSINAWRIYNYLLTQIKASDPDDQVYVLYVRNIAIFAGISSNKIYADIDKATDELHRAFFAVQQEHGGRRKIQYFVDIGVCEMKGDALYRDPSQT